MVSPRRGNSYRPPLQEGELKNNKFIAVDSWKGLALCVCVREREEVDRRHISDKNEGSKLQAADWMGVAGWGLPATTNGSPPCWARREQKLQ